MEPPSKSSAQAGPGSLLRQARERRALSIDDVAEALRLAPRIIGALEEDAYARLPGPTYVRGYLRSYALFLDMNPQRLIEIYNARPEAAQRTDMTSPTPVRQITSSDAMVRMGTVLVIVVVLGLVALWWSGHNRSVTGTPPLVLESSSAAPVEATDDQAPAPELIAQAPASETPPPVERENRQEVAAPQPVAEPVNVESPAERASLPERLPNPSVPLSRLVLYLHEDSWADVRDARQRRLLYETIPAGRVVTVEGVAPLSVFLGNVDGVTVEFDGEQYDALRHRRGEVARFTLGKPRG